MSLKALKAEIQRVAENIRGGQLDAGPTVIVVDVVNASSEGSSQIVPAGYTCHIKGKRHFFPGTSDEAVAAARTLIDLEPRVRGAVRPVPVLMACLEAPTNEPTADSSGSNEATV